MVNYNDVKGDIEVMENAVMKVSAKVYKFKEAEKLFKELAGIQIIIGRIKKLFLEG